LANHDANQHLAFLGSKLTAALASHGYSEKVWATNNGYKATAFNTGSAQHFPVWTPTTEREGARKWSSYLGILFNELLLSARREIHESWLFLVRPLYVANYVVTYIYKKKKLTRDESENASRAKKGLPWLYSGP
jgi:hypothetical protein